MVVMMAKKEEMNNPAGSAVDNKKQNAKCNQVILDHFWTVCDPSEEKRCRSAQVILQTLANQINRKFETNDIQYCLDRIVRGLISTREFARHGFCVLLSAILSEFPEQTDLKQVFESAKKEFGQKINQETASENSIAWALFLTAFLKSGRLSGGQDPELITEIFNYVLILGTKKEFVEIIACDMINGLLGAVSEREIADTYLEVFKNFDEEKKKSIFFTYSILLINKHFPDLEDKYVSTYITTNIYKRASKKFEKIANICKESTKSYPNIHPIISILIDTIHKIDAENFDVFFSTIIEKLLSSNFEKVLLAFEIVKTILGYVKPEQISKLLSPSFMEMFIKALAWKDNPNHHKGVELGEYLVEFSNKTQDNSELHIEIVKCFIEKPGGIHFDELSKSKILSSIIKNFSDESVQAWTKLLKNVMLEEEDVPQSDFTRLRCYQQFVSALKQYKKMDSFVVKNVQFLFCHAFIDFKNAKKIQLTKGEKIHNFKVPPSQKLADSFSDGFKNILVHISQLTVEKTDSKQNKLAKKTAVLKNILDSLREILADEKIEMKEAFNKGEILGHIDNILAKVQQIDELPEQSVQGDTFKFLYLNFAIEVFENIKEIDVVLPDFDECVNRCLLVKKTKGRKSKKTDATNDEPQWADVLTDLLLSLLSKNSKHIKSVVLLSFRQIAPFVTKAGIDAITDAFMGKTGAEESDDEDEDDDDVEKMDVDNTEDGADEEDEDDEDSEESDDADDDEDEEVDPVFKQKLIEALGDAADVSDEDEVKVVKSASKQPPTKKAKKQQESEEEDDDDDDAMDDEAMFRIDDALAEVFRMKFSDKKKNQSEREQLINFRSRAIELSQMIVEHKEDLDFGEMLEILQHMIQLTRSTYLVKNMVQLANKCSVVFESLYKRKNFANINKVNDEQFLNVLKSLVAFQYKCTDKPMKQRLVQITVWLLNVVKEDVSGANKKAIHELFEQALKDYCLKSVEVDKNLFVRSVPVFNQIEKSSFVQSSFYKILVENCFRKELRTFRRSQAFELMALILGNLKNSFKDNTCYTELALAAITQLDTDLNEFIQTTNKKEAKPSGQYLNAALRLISHTNIFEKINEDKLKTLAPQLGQLVPKFEKVPKETRRKIDKGFIKKVNALNQE